MRLPEKSRGGDLFSFMHLDAVSSQDGGAHLAGSLAAVDEENFFVGRSRRPRSGGRYIRHPETRTPFEEGDSAKVCAEKGLEST